MTQVTTFGPSPDTILPTEFNNVQDDYNAFGQQVWPLFHFFRTAPLVNNTYIEQGSTLAAGADSGSSNIDLGTGYFTFFFNPADHIDAVNQTRLVRLGLRVGIVLGAGTGGSTQNITLAIHKVNSFNTALVANSFSAVAGASVAFTAADASLATKVATVDATSLTAGLYAINAAVSAAAGTQVATVIGQAFMLAS